jgi:glycosyltransferase involved in cell wall biosynthesis
MRVLLVHNYYQQQGGEDVVVENERELLQRQGHLVFTYIRNNGEVNKYSLGKKVSLLWETTYSDPSFRAIKHLIQKVVPDVVHIHNTLPLITPSVYYACEATEAPVVQTLHNYRLLCPVATFFRDRHVCEECIQHSLARSVIYGCYRDSRIQTLAVAHMLAKHRKMGTWWNQIDAYICLTEFARSKFANHLPEEKLFVKPNFLADDPGFSPTDDGYLLFVGRLDQTKGLPVLLSAASKLQKRRIYIAGDGPLRSEVVVNPYVNYLGHLSRENAFTMIRTALALLLPSVWYEGFPMAIVEAFACGKPVIGSRLGSIAELIEEGKTGLLFEPGNGDDVVEKIHWAQEHPEEMRRMGMNARKEYAAKYTAEQNYKILMSIYEHAIENSKNKR